MDYLQYYETVQGLGFSIEDAGFNIKYSTIPRVPDKPEQNALSAAPANDQPPGQPSSPGQSEPRETAKKPPGPIPGKDHPLPDLIHTHEELLKSQNQFITSTISPEGQESLQLAGQLDNGDYILISLPMVSIEDNAGIAGEFSLLAAILVLALGLLIIAYASGRITRPIQELNQIAQHIASLNFDRQFEDGRHDELGELGHSLNSMSTQLKQAIDDLQCSNEQLQADIERERKLDQTRRDFIANVSHELKTPLALVSGYSLGLMENVNSDEDKNYYCEVIHDETAKMTALVRQLLDLAQIESGGIKPEASIFDLPELVQGIIRKHEINLGRCKLSVELAGPDSLSVWADPLMTEQVLGNYLANALNHVDELGRITIQWVASGDKARVSVYNSGSAIPEDALDEVWNSFYKADPARSRDYGGTGLGLAVVKAIQEAQHNAYGVRNSLEGVEFWMELDLA